MRFKEEGDHVIALALTEKNEKQEQDAEHVETESAEEEASAPDETAGETNGN